MNIRQLNPESLCACSVHDWMFESEALTIIGVQDLDRCCRRKLHHSHHRLREQNLESFSLLILPISEDPNPPRSRALPWVKLDLPLRLSPEVLVFLCTAILGANSWKTQKVTDIYKKRIVERKGGQARWGDSQKKMKERKKATIKGWQTGERNRWKTD